MTVASTTELVDSLTRSVASHMQQTHADLEKLVRIPSINFPDYDKGPVVACAQACAALLRDAGAEVELLVGEDGIPTVRADIDGPPGSPTVMLYSHYDVQPAGDLDKWDSPPFDPEVRDGRLYGRGAADDKSGVVTLHLHRAGLPRQAAGEPAHLSGGRRRVWG